MPVYMGESRTELTRGHKWSAQLISFENHTRSGLEKVLHGSQRARHRVLVPRAPLASDESAGETPPTSGGCVSGW